MNLKKIRYFNVNKKTSAISKMSELHILLWTTNDGRKLRSVPVLRSTIADAPMDFARYD